MYCVGEQAYGEQRSVRKMEPNNYFCPAFRQLTDEIVRKVNIYKANQRIFKKREQDGEKKLDFSFN